MGATAAEGGAHYGCTAQAAWLAQQLILDPLLMDGTKTAMAEKWATADHPTGPTSRSLQLHARAEARATGIGAGGGGMAAGCPLHHSAPIVLCAAGH